ncbi:amidase [Arthrobacter sp. H14-L1]|uniref:amidase n=1 Tax=Arthrobacter sp. H14-L1 TaxID=2996697 RepID=UPI0022714B01|nr:amidase [Arthrobacter sp. H14-L1]MCY0905779.1 amidase [Arthrobacter sp. H14-L1]
MPEITTEPTPIHTMDAGTLAAAIRDRQVTAVQAVTAYLERIERYNHLLGAIVSPGPARLRSEALARAAAADEAQARGEVLGPLHGVPFTVKDTLAVVGYPTTAGSMVLKDYIPEATATVIARILAAGAIFLGKANCSEFAVDTHAGNLLFGDSRNPLDTTRTPGGSSGGDAVAVAAGLSAFGIGTDFGGSVRWPAHCTGTLSMRPTIGLLPGTGILPYDTTAPIAPPNSSSVLHRYMTAGPITRSVDDLELLVRIMAGPDGLDAQTAPVTVPSSKTIDISTLSVAWCAGEGTVPIRSDVVAALSAAAGKLTPSVASVREQRPPRLNEAAGLFLELRDAEGLPEVAKAIHQAQAEQADIAVTPGILAYLDSVEATLTNQSASDALTHLLAATARRDAVYTAVSTFLNDHPILLLPVASVTAPLIGTTSEQFDGAVVPWSQLGSSCRAISILALPSAVIPIGHGENGMPIGIQVIGRRFHDHEVLAVARELERLS